MKKLILLLIPTAALYAENPIAEDIKAAGDALIKFSTVEICIISATVLVSIAIIWLGRHWLKNRAKRTEAELQIRMTELNNERNQVETENNALLKNVETAIEQDRLERIKRQTEYDNKFTEYDKRFDRLEASQESLIHAVSEQEEKYYKVSQGTLENMLFNDNHKCMFDRLKAFYRLTAMGINGRVYEKGYNLILHNKEMWRDVLSLKLNVEFVDLDYFDKTMEVINIEIYNRTMGRAR